MKKLAATFVLIQFGFNLFGQSLLKNHVKFTPMRLLNTYGAPGYMIQYERIFSKHHSLEFTFLRVTDPLSNNGTYFNLEKLKGFGAGIGYRYSFQLHFLKYVFKTENQFPYFFFQPNLLYSQSKQNVEWTFERADETEYLDSYKQVAKMYEWYFIAGIRIYFDPKERLNFETFLGSGINNRITEHIGRENINDQAQILDEWDLSFYKRPGEWIFNGLTLGFKIGYKF